MKKTFEQMCIVLMPNEQPSLVSEPTDCWFDFPPLLVSSQRSTILARRFLAPFAMRRDLFDATPLEGISKPVGVGCLVVKKSFGTFPSNLDIDQRLNRTDFGGLSRHCECRDGIPCASVISMSFVPLPFLVLPTSEPLFLQAKRCHHPLPATSPVIFAGPWL